MGPGGDGRVPDWYRKYRAARLLNCSPFDLEERGDDGEWWINRALMAEQAEQIAQRNWDKTRR